MNITIPNIYNNSNKSNILEEGKKNEEMLKEPKVANAL